MNVQAQEDPKLQRCKATPGCDMFHPLLQVEVFT